MSPALFTEISRTLSLTGVVSAAVATIAVRNLEDRLKSVTAEEWKESSGISLDAWPRPSGKVADLYFDAVAVLNSSTAPRVVKGSDADTIVQAAAKVLQTRLDAIAEHLLTMPAPALITGLDMAAEGTESSSVETRTDTNGETADPPQGDGVPANDDANAQPAVAQ